LTAPLLSTAALLLVLSFDFSVTSQLA
jgi:hypothetical protein